MTTMAGRQAVDAPQATPPVYGLLKAATVENIAPPTNETDGDRWGGVKWAPEQLGGGDVICVDCEGLSGALQRAVNPVVGVADPFLVYAEDHCSTIGSGQRQFVARAQRQLAATRSFLIAREFQLGALRDSCDLENVVLEDAIELNDPGAGIAEGFAIMEQQLATVFRGRRSMIHVDPGTMLLAKAQFIVELSGSQWITANGTIVASDAGYAPVEGQSFIYGTTLVKVRLSPVMVPATFEQSVDRSTNSVTVWAQQFAAIQFDNGVADPGDRVFKIAVDTPVLSGS